MYANHGVQLRVGIVNWNADQTDDRIIRETENREFDSCSSTLGFRTVAQRWSVRRQDEL